MYRGSAPLKFDVGSCFLDQVYLFSLLLPFNPGDIFSSFIFHFRFNIVKQTKIQTI